MQTNRFETFMDAVLAIIITVLVLKIPQPDNPTWNAILKLNIRYISYFICYVIIFNIWFNNHNLFQMVEEIDNSVVVVNGILLFVISLIPYFATWLSLNPQSIPAEVMFGLLFILANIFYILATYLVVRANPYNEKLKKTNLMSINVYIPLIVICIGYLFTFTLYTPGVFVACVLSALCWFIFAVKGQFEIESSERFEALIDAIVAIILTIIVLEIPMAVNGSWEALFDIKIEFIAYAISFIVCFNFWNYNHNLFSIVNKINGKVIWSLGASMFVLSVIPYLTTFVAENFYSFVPQACYGIDFIIIALISIVTSNALKDADKGNVALLMALRKNSHYISTLIIVAVGMIIGYLVYPPAVIISCLLSIIWIWIYNYIRLTFN